MNTYLPRSLRLIPSTGSDSRLAPVTGRVEAHALAGHMVNTSPSAQPSVPGDPRPSEPVRMLRLAQVATMTGLSKAKIYELQRQGDFPQRVQLTAGRVAWVEAEVQTWLAARIASNTSLARR
jgi:prophage regulatory protein